MRVIQERMYYRKVIKYLGSSREVGMFPGHGLGVADAICTEP